MVRSSLRRLALRLVRLSTTKPEHGLKASESYGSSTNTRKTTPVVWLINQYAIPPGEAGITRHAELAEQLRLNGWVPRVFAAAFNHNTGRSIREVHWYRPSISDSQGSATFTWLISSPYRGNGVRRYINMVTFSLAMIGVGVRQPRPDVIIASSPHLLTGLSGYLLARRYRTPFVLEVRDMWPDMLVQLGLTSPFVIRPLERLEAFLYRRSDRIIALTDGISSRIVEKHVDASKITMIPNGILHPDKLSESRRAQIRRQNGWDGKIVVAWAGSHNQMNGLDVVLETARLLQKRNEIHFAFIGDGALKKSLVAQAKELRNVDFFDPLPKTEIRGWLQAADIGLIHSRRFEVFTGARPNKLFDYMASGLPIVSTVPGEAWELIERANAGVKAEWENPDSLAAAICRLADDADVRREMGRSGNRAVSIEHSRESAGAALSQLLMEVIESRVFYTRRKGATEDIPHQASLLDSNHQERTSDAHAAD